MKPPISALLLTACLAAACPAAPAQNASQKLDALQNQAHAFVTANVPGKARVQIAPLDPQLQLPACLRPEIFVPPSTGALRGSVRIGARCTQPHAWTVYLTASIQEARTYYLAKETLEAGHVLSAADLVAAQAFPDELPPGAVIDERQWQGRSLTQAVTAGSPLRLQWLRTEMVINAGQTVRLQIDSAGFRISSEGRALHSAAAGQQVQVRTSSGQVVSGKAQAGGWVEISP